MSEAVDKIRQLLDPILLSMGLDLWDLEFHKQGPKWLLRVYIDREIGGGVPGRLRDGEQGSGRRFGC